MKQTCVIIEDEKMSRLKLEEYVRKSDELELIGSFENPIKAITFMREQQPEIIFLDVEMPEINGFELLDSIVFQPIIILTTAHKEYAYKGFQYDITSFLLKPFTLPNFISTLEKIFTKNEIEKPKEIYVKIDGEFIKILINEIKYIEAYGDYIKIYTADKRFIPRAKMATIEKKLPNSSFTRIHRSYIVNHLFIEKIEDHFVSFGGKILPIATNKVSVLMRKLNLL